MRITVLMDNNTLIDVYHLGEPGVSYWIEDGDKAFLFDVGYSSAFLKNAKELSIDISTVDAVMLSHGHNDHTGGLTPLADSLHGKKPELICHPLALLPRSVDGLSIGYPGDRKTIKEHFSLIETKKPYWLTEHLVFLGEIPREIPFEPPVSIGMLTDSEGQKADFIEDDTALAYSTDNGIYIITGCSHAGICNIIAYAKKVTGKEKILGILGGLHLFETGKRAKETVSFLEKEHVKELYPCHCTSFGVKALLHQKCPIKEVGVGLILNWE